MKRLSCDMLVVGGGATGAGIAWDASLRGFSVILVEKGDLTHGTTGRYHGLLHSGARYVISDPQTAVECIQENRILRHTHPHCIEETGGLFVVTPADEGEYPDQFVAGCTRAGIPCQEITPTMALRQEGLLNPRLSRAFAVPDATADSFLATRTTATAAQQLGATILTYHELTSLLLVQGEIVGAQVMDRVRGEVVAITTPMVINATGAWAAQLCQMAGIPLTLIAGKGVMLATNHRIVNTVINRCKHPGDGDIIVPIHTVAVLGTTDERVTNPDQLTITAAEVELILNEADHLIPGIRQARLLRAWAGVRPLYDAGFTGDSRDASRATAILNHQERDGIKGMVTVVGGKWTTFRLMAQEVVDIASQQLVGMRPCTTATTPVPSGQQSHYWLGHRLHDVEVATAQGELVCECELVTRTMFEESLNERAPTTVDDLRRDLRLGMGPCQGGFCTFRAVGILQSHPQGKALHPNRLLRDFLQERWKGLTPILWGSQLQQERLDQLIYFAIMGVDQLPDDDPESPMTPFYHYQPEEDAHE